MNDRETLRTDLNVFADFNPKLPESYRAEPYLLLGNIQPELQRSVRAQMTGVQLTGGDTMNYWINDFRPATAGDPEAVGLPADQRQRSPPAVRRDTTCAAPPPKSWRWGRTPWSSSAANTAPSSSAATATSWCRAICCEDVFDPTGAGDCFAGGFIGYLAGRGISPRDGDIDFADLRRAVIYGSVMGSFCCEKFGVDRFRTLTRDEIEARYQEFKTCTAF